MSKNITECILGVLWNICTLWQAFFYNHILTTPGIFWLLLVVWYSVMSKRNLQPTFSISMKMVMMFGENLSDIVMLSFSKCTLISHIRSTIIQNITTAIALSFILINENTFSNRIKYEEKNPLRQFVWPTHISERPSTKTHIEYNLTGTCINTKLTFHQLIKNMIILYSSPKQYITLI